MRPGPGLDGNRGADDVVGEEAVVDGTGGTVRVAGPAAPTAPARQGWVLDVLISVAAVANLNLAVANVALPDIGEQFRASQTELNLVSVGFSLGLAGTVLYLGAVGDRYGRKRMLLLGMATTVPTALLAAWAPTVGVLIVARILGGVAAGMAFPTTLALITALWDGSARTRSIALWSAAGGTMLAIAPLLAGWLLTVAWWDSVFLLTAPLAVAALLLAAVVVPAHVNETTGPVDHLGGMLSIIGIVALVLAINVAPSPGEGPFALVAGGLAVVAPVGFVLRQRTAPEPLEDALGRVALLGRGGLVGFEDLLDNREERAELRLSPGCLAAIPGRCGMGEDLLQRPPPDAELQAHGALRVLLHQHPAPDGCPLVHVGMHPSPVCSEPFLARKPGRGAEQIRGWSGAVVFDRDPQA
jgi:MFS family permease